MIKVIKTSRNNLSKQIVKMITDSRPEHISSLDACQCTGGCQVAVK